MFRPWHDQSKKKNTEKKQTLTIISVCGGAYWLQYSQILSKTLHNPSLLLGHKVEDLVN